MTGFPMPPRARSTVRYIIVDPDDDIEEHYSFEAASKALRYVDDDRTRVFEVDFGAWFKGQFVQSDVTREAADKWWRDQGCRATEMWIEDDCEPSPFAERWFPGEVAEMRAEAAEPRSTVNEHSTHYRGIGI